MEPQLDTLLKHADFVRELARSLLQDESAADDAVQQTWLAAVKREREPESNRPLDDPRAWLARVLRNFIGQHRREKARRIDREPGTPHAQSCADTTTVVEQLELHAKLVEAVRSLREPYRSTIALRFLEGLPPRSVAERLEVSVETVRTRVRRGLELLRQELDRAHHGDRTAWFRALAPFAAAPPTLAPSSAPLTPSSVGVLEILFMGTKSKLALGAVLAVAAIWAWTEWTHDPNSIGSEDSLVVAGPDQARPVEQREPDRSASLPAAEAGANAEARKMLESTASTPSVGHSPPVITGTLVLLDGPAGTNHRVESGRLLLAPPGASEDEARAIEIVHGSWSFEAGVDEQFECRALEIEPPAYVLDPPLLQSDRSPFHLRARVIPRSTLRVVDSASGQDLAQVEVVRVQAWEPGLFCPNRTLPHETLVQGERSPIDLPLRDGVVRYWVRAEGYCWDRVKVDHRQGREYRVELDRGARLRVHALPDDLPAPIEIRLYPGGHDDPFAPLHTAAPLVQGEPTTFIGLPSGDYQVRAEIGEFLDPPIAFALNEIRLQPGEHRELTLELDARLMGPAPASLAGTLELPRGLSPDEIRLEIRPANGPKIRAHDHQWIERGRMTRAEGSNLWQWQARPVTPGRVKLVVHPFQITTVVTLPESGANQVRLVVPELARVHVRVANAESGQLLPTVMLGWSRFEPGLRFELDPKPDSPEEHAIPMEWIRPAGRVGQFEFRAPVGPVYVGVGTNGFEEEGRWVDVKPGENEIEFALAPLPTLVIGFLDEGKLISEAPGFTVRATDGSSSWNQWDRVGSRYLGYVEEPGFYQIEGKIKGYLPIPPRQVFITPGDRVEIDIPLMRE